MAREYTNIADAISAVNDEVSAQTTQIADILTALEGKSSGGEFVKVGTAETIPNGGGQTYGQLSFAASDGVFLLTNVSVTPNATNRLPWALLCRVDTTTPTQSAAVVAYTYGGSGITTNNSSQSDGKVYYNSSSSVRFNTSATYDIYRLY